MASTSTVAGFTVFPLKYSPDVTQYMYGRPHSKPKKAVSSEFPDGRTLFLVNVPPDATERELSVLFKSCGTIEKVVFEKYNVVKEEPVESSESEDDETDSDSPVVENQDENTQGGNAPSRKRKKGHKEKEKAPIVKPLQISSIRQLRRTGGTAHVVFLDSSSLDRAIAQPQKPRIWPLSNESDEPCGLSRYIAQYDALRPSMLSVREHADTAIQAYDYAQARLKQKSKYKKGEAIVDEEGFTLVTRGGAYGKTLGGGVGVTSKRFMEEQEGKRAKKKKKTGMEKEGLYAFQVHEKKRKELLEIKKNFEEDKAKIAKLKASRTFKPY